MDQIEGCGYSKVYWTVGMIHKLKRFQCGGQQGINVPHDKPFETHHDGRECDGTVFVKAGH